MKITLIGTGCGTADTLTVQGKNALEAADLIIGAGRILSSLSAFPAEKKAAVDPGDIINIIESSACGKICVAFSGDSGFYSGAKPLLPKLYKLKDAVVELLPGISSLQALASRLARPWQDWELCSLHGRDGDILRALSHGRPVFCLTGGMNTPSEICRKLWSAGLGELSVTIAEDLTLPGERISSGTAEELMSGSYSSLSVMLLEALPLMPRRTPGIPDKDFIRGSVPMTKQLVRASVLAKLAVSPSEICWDVGAGTGSVSVELALNSARVYAVEKEEDALTLIEANRSRFNAWNIDIIKGCAPEVLAPLPSPDAVFIGGSSGSLGGIVDAVFEKNANARICVAAVCIETLQSALSSFERHGCAYDIVQLSVTETRGAGSLHMLSANNPVFLITADGKGAAG